MGNVCGKKKNPAIIDDEMLRNARTVDKKKTIIAENEQIYTTMEDSSGRGTRMGSGGGVQQTNH